MGAPPEGDIAPVCNVFFAIYEFVTPYQIVGRALADDPVQYILPGASLKKHHIIHFGVSCHLLNLQLLSPLGQHRTHTDPYRKGQQETVLL